MSYVFNHSYEINVFNHSYEINVFNHSYKSISMTSYEINVFNHSFKSISMTSYEIIASQFQITRNGFTIKVWHVVGSRIERECQRCV